jgi:hypothetical protein
VGIVGNAGQCMVCDMWGMYWLYGSACISALRPDRNLVVV